MKYKTNKRCMNKRIFSVLLAVVMLFMMIPETSFANETLILAKEVSDTSSNETVLGPFIYTYINPEYADIINEEEITNQTISAYDIAAIPQVMALDEPKICETVEEVAELLRDNMESRQQTFSISFKMKECTETLLKNELSVIFEEALKHTGIPTEGDYLRKGYAHYNTKANATYDSVLQTYIITANYTFTYYTTAEQEAAVENKIEEILDGFQFTGDTTDYEKVCMIYDYLCDNIKYDYTNLEDDTYTLKYTPYAALINNTAVCQGYALSFYRMALEAGVDARYISGIGAGGNHGWNIVELDDLYYNLDATWDAPRVEEGVDYAYFLKCASDFEDHTRSSEFETDDFYALYPKPSANYVKKTPATASVTIEDWNYGDEAKTPMPVSKTNGTTKVTYEYKVKDAAEYTYTKEVPSEVGEYILKATFAATDTYSEGVACAEFSIKKRPIIITIDSKTKSIYSGHLIQK